MWSEAIRRAVTTFALLVSAIALGTAAVAQPGIDMQLDRSGAGSRNGDRLQSAEAGLMRQWAAVGKCVVQRDRNSSVAFVRAAQGSQDATDAARRLDPVFAGCLAGSRVPGPSSATLRRAALANALGMGRVGT